MEIWLLTLNRSTWCSLEYAIPVTEGGCLAMVSGGEEQGRKIGSDLDQQNEDSMMLLGGPFCTED